MRNRYSIFAGLLLGLAGFSEVRAETPTKHVRVIVDTSASLHKTDPSGYVKLATELFYDLSLKELERNDTFKVATFDTNWPKVTEPPATLDTRLVIEPGRQPAEVREFHNRMRGLEYKTPWTYFSPCIQWALDDLRNYGSNKDNRIIVLITDGVPDPHVIAADEKRIEQLRVPLRQNNIRVFVLAFGQEAQKDWFDHAFQFGSDGPAGEVFAGSDTNHLLPDMLQIFSRSFGFAKEPVPDPKAQRLNVARDLTLQRAAVVAVYNAPGYPDFTLKAPPGKPLVQGQSSPEKAEHDPLFRNPWHPVSYAFKWLQPPEQGEYEVQHFDAVPVEVAILRPVKVQATIRPYKGNSIEAIMAGKPAPMEVLVSPGPGTSGDPGDDIHVRFYLRYISQDDRGEDSGRVISVQGKGIKTQEGRVFRIDPEFLKNPRGADPGKPYTGFIDVEVTQFDSPVYRMGALMHKVQVYPYISIGVTPNPATVTNKQDKELIQSGQAGCIDVKFSDNTRSLKAERYTLAVRIDNMPGNSGPWRGAKFHFNSEELHDYGGPPGWQFTRSFRTDDLLKKPHPFCVDVGSPTRQELAHQLSLHFGVWGDNADINERQLNSVEDLPALVSIAAPGFWQTWGPWIILLLTMLLMYLLYLLLLSRQLLAPDIRVSLAAGRGTLQWAPLATRSPVLSWLGISEDRPVVSLAGNRELGKLRPLREGLFAFVPGQGYRTVSVESGGSWVPVEKTGDGSYLVSAGKVYQAGIGADLHSFRIEYSAERPRL